MFRHLDSYNASVSSLREQILGQANALEGKLTDEQSSRLEKLMLMYGWEKVE
jgi:hypothetical protein